MSIADTHPACVTYRWSSVNYTLISRPPKVACTINACMRARAHTHTSHVADREELARLRRLCQCYPEHEGVYIDAVDNNKFQVPTTKK